MVLAANLVALAGSLLMVWIGFLHDGRKILTVQTAMFALLAVANLMLGALTGCVANVISVVRNLYSLKKPVSRQVKVLFIVIQVVVSLIAGIDGFISWLPIFASVLLTVFVDEKDVMKLKLVLIIVQFLWLIYDFTFKNYSATVFDVLTILSHAVTMYRIHKKQIA